MKNFFRQRTAKRRDRAARNQLHRLVTSHDDARTAYLAMRLGLQATTALQTVETIRDPQAAEQVRRQASHHLSEMAAELAQATVADLEQVLTSVRALGDSLDAELAACREVGLKPAELLVAVSPADLEQARQHADVQGFTALYDECAGLSRSARSALLGSLAYYNSYSLDVRQETPRGLDHAAHVLIAQNSRTRSSVRFSSERVTVQVRALIKVLRQVQAELTRVADKLDLLAATRASQEQLPVHVSELAEQVARLRALRASREELQAHLDAEVPVAQQRTARR